MQLRGTDSCRPVRDYKMNSYVIRRGVGEGEACVSPFEERVISVIVSTMRLFRGH